MKEIILHIGFHKTATTSIQLTSFMNLKILEKQGFHYPVFYNKETIINNHSIPIYSVFSSASSLYYINILLGNSEEIEYINDCYFKQLEEILNKKTKVLMSGEDISLLNETELNKLKCYFESKGFQVNVYCSVRKPYSFTCSFLQQLVKSGMENLLSINVPEKSKDIVKLINVFGKKVNFYSYEEDCLAACGPVRKFFERVGVDHNELKIFNENKGFGNITTRIYAEINICHPIFRSYRFFKYPLLDEMELFNENRREYCELNIDNNKFLLTKNELSNVECFLNCENENIGVLLGGKFKDNKYMVSKDVAINTDLIERIENSEFKEYVINYIK